MPSGKDGLDHEEHIGKSSFYVGLFIGSVIGASAMLSVCQLYDITHREFREHVIPNPLEKTVMDADTTSSQTNQPSKNY